MNRSVDFIIYHPVGSRKSRIIVAISIELLVNLFAVTFLMFKLIFYINEVYESSINRPAMPAERIVI